MGVSSALRHPGVRAALLSALLFGAGAPAAKAVLGETGPFLMAGLLYTGSGVGLGLYRLLTRAQRVRPNRADLLPLAGAIGFGGIIAPVLLMVGLTSLPASTASLLLNAEGVATAVLAWLVFKENADRRVVLGMLAIVAGAVILAVPQGVESGTLWPSAAVLGACLCWGIDNNLTRKVALTDAGWLASVKGLVAGPVNLGLAAVLGEQLPALPLVGAALSIGLLAYGVSLVLFVIGMRHVGTARAGAYFSVAPFFGALIALAAGEHASWSLVIAGLLMALGVWLHLTERHEHVHTHDAVSHDHWHTHDEHHQHDRQHDQLGIVFSGSGGHRHLHTHEAITHTHPHYPDSHHRHEH